MKSAHDLVAQAKAHIHEIDLQDAELAIRNADALIDVREPDEFAQGHIPGAINIPRGLLEFRLSATQELAPRDLKLVLYCKTSGRAALAAASLKDMGYLQVSSLNGGFDAWTEAGKEVQQASLPSFE